MNSESVEPECELVIAIKVANSTGERQWWGSMHVKTGAPSRAKPKFNSTDNMSTSGFLLRRKRTNKPGANHYKPLGEFCILPHGPPPVRNEPGEFLKKRCLQKHLYKQIRQHNSAHIKITNFRARLVEHL